MSASFESSESLHNWQYIQNFLFLRTERKTEVHLQGFSPTCSSLLPQTTEGYKGTEEANIKMSDLKVHLPYLSRKPTVHLKTPPKATSSPNITEK